MFGSVLGVNLLGLLETDQGVWTMRWLVWAPQLFKEVP